MPLGLYRETAPRFERGTLALVCLPVEIARFGREREYLTAGDCPEGVSPIVKQIAAVVGDEIELQMDFVAVNGKLVDRTALSRSDSRGRPLTPERSGKQVVADGQIWVFGMNRKRSWDSRYFGPIPVSSVIGSARPLLTVGSH